MSQAEASEPRPADEPVSSSLGATSIAAVDAPHNPTSFAGNECTTEAYPKDDAKLVRIASPSSSSPSSPSSTVLSTSTLSSSPDTPTALSTSTAMTPAMAEVAISTTAVVSASNFDTADAPSTPETSTNNKESERIATPSPSNTTSTTSTTSTSTTTPPSTAISTTAPTNNNNNNNNKATPSSPLSPLPSPPSSSTMVTDKADKGHPIPTSNALSYSLKSRLSSAAPLSSLSSVTPSSIISPKPYSSYHTTVSSSGLTSPSSSQPLSPTKDAHRPLNPVSVYSSSSSKSFEREEEAKDYSPCTYPRASMSSAKDRYSTSPVYQRQQESEYEDEEEEEGDEDEYEMDEEYGSDSGLPMEHDSGLPYEHDTEMDASTRSLSPHPINLDASKASSPQLAQETDKVSPTTSTPTSTSTPSAATKGIATTTTTSGKKTGVSATSCANCGTTTTPLWRRASDGQTICNACGLYFKARNSTRPPWLKRNMGLKKGDTSTGEAEESEDPNPTPSAPDASDANEPSNGTATGETKGDAESCPGDGNCNGIGGAHTCSGCPSFNQQHTNRQNLICANCRTTTTPLWRRDSSGNTICNACGLYFKLHNVHRPVTMKRAVIKRRKRVNLLTTSPPLQTAKENGGETRDKAVDEVSHRLKALAATITPRLITMDLPILHRDGHRNTE
ncbi:putative electron transfer flavoprotein subunit [Haplosporangium bisporale]|nr:putative electron transfer flavoprotein subunit [Haplosporangium bisporale]